MFVTRLAATLEAITGAVEPEPQIHYCDDRLEQTK